MVVPGVLQREGVVPSVLQIKDTTASPLYPQCTTKDVRRYILVITQLLVVLGVLKRVDILPHLMVFPVTTKIGTNSRFFSYILKYNRISRLSLVYYRQKILPQLLVVSNVLYRENTTPQPGFPKCTIDGRYYPISWLSLVY